MANLSVREQAEPVNCCDADAAWQWVLAIAELALDGDRDGRRLIGEAVAHAIQAERR